MIYGDLNSVRFNGYYDSEISSRCLLFSMSLSAVVALACVCFIVADSIFNKSLSSDGNSYDKLYYLLPIIIVIAICFLLLICLTCVALVRMSGNANNEQLVLQKDSTHDQQSSIKDDESCVVNGACAANIGCVTEVNKTNDRDATTLLLL